MARFSLLPRDRTFFDLFIEAGQNTLRASRLLDEMMHTWPEAGGLSREILKAEQEGDRISRDAVASLFSNGIDPMVVIRWKDMFAVLENAIDATEIEMKAPTKLSSEATAIATCGRAAPVEIEVATTLAVSWKPFV